MINLKTLANMVAIIAGLRLSGIIKTHSKLVEIHISAGENGSRAGRGSSGGVWLHGVSHELKGLNADWRSAFLWGEGLCCSF